MKSLRSHEGEFLFDHRNSPGIPDEVMLALGLPLGSGRGVYEGPSYTCRHCQYTVMMNPDRKRERTRCTKCNHRLCDGCGAAYALTGECHDFERVIDELLNKASQT